MKTPDIINRLTAAAVMLNDYEQHNDNPEEVFGDRIASETIDEAIELIAELVKALNIAKCYMEEDGDDEQEQEDYSLIIKAIQKATN